MAAVISVLQAVPFPKASSTALLFLLVLSLNPREKTLLCLPEVCGGGGWILSVLALLALSASGGWFSP